MRTAPKTPKEAEPASPPSPTAAPAPAAEEKAGRKEKPAKGKEGKGKAPKPEAGAGTKKAKKVPDNPDFRYIVRVANTDLDGTRAVGLALTGVRGVGLRMAEVVCRSAGVNAAEMIGNLPETTVDGIEQVLSQLPEKLPNWMLNHPIDYAAGAAHHFVGGDLETARRDDVNMMKMVRSYRGVRHERGQKVRGQRTRSNGRTGMAAGVLKKAAKEAAAAKATEEKPAAAAATPAPAAAPAPAKKEKA